MDLSTEAPKRRSSDSSSPEFEFWVVGNPSHPQQELLTADELFVDGVLLPLHLLSVVHSEPEPRPEPEPEPEPAETPPEPSQASISSSPSSGSKRWKDIFKVGEKKGEEKEGQRRERRSGGGGAAELNINIWPFSRSRSAGNGASAGRRRASAMAGRKASSAPCSRSNSRGESSKPSAAAAAGSGGSTKRWAASPGRAGLSGGVHLGRTSPVWQIRRGEKRIEPAAGRGLERANQGDKVTGSKKGSGLGGGGRVLNLNVNTCIGYRNQVSCRGDDKDGATDSGQTAGEAGGSNRSFFSLRSFFSKKVY
ncbi:translation initiation factor IF-2-like [Cocos nucifera]|uniref:Translation initiation factor IF-2-like n=1 Tax=Cocos nucifera TaxID=13894 RepID=A0A8K0MXT1_COCNU|nr:translation initiation factor IF-2-like [Cocos nucifera]